MREGTAAFELQDIAKPYGPGVAHDGVDLHIDSAATTALIGPSGAGKSTVLRMLIGLDWPDRGVVRFDGEPLRRERLLEQRRRIGYVIQEGGLFPHLTAADNVALVRSEEHTSELQSLMRISYAVFCLKKKKKKIQRQRRTNPTTRIQTH